MPDIAMCTRRECPRRVSCYRYVANPSPHRQTYFSPEPESCTEHMLVVEGDRTLPSTDVDSQWDRITKEKTHEGEASH